jgi:hypothetical protein
MLVETSGRGRGGLVMSFNVSFRGRLRKVPVSVKKSVHALFEAVANAFDATASLKGNGQITITILRKKTGIFAESASEVSELFGYEIRDNGVGFDDEHFNHFMESDTEFKSNGLGVGRLTWLHVFNHAEVSSIYESQGRKYRREFVFSIEKKGVDPAEARPKVVDAESNFTTVRLLRPKGDRLTALPSEVLPLANQLLEHFLLKFTALSDGQSVTVVDEVSGETVQLAKLCEEEIADRYDYEEFSLGENHLGEEHRFVLHHVFARPKISRMNTISLCANSRVVSTELVKNWVSEVDASSSITTDKSLRYRAYVTSNYFNDIVDDSRLILKFPPDEDYKEDDSQLAWTNSPEIREAASTVVTKARLFEVLAEKIRAKLRPHVEDVRKLKEQKLESYASAKQPQFLPYVERAKGHLDRLKLKPSDKDIELALYEAKFDGREELGRIVDSIISKSESHQMVGEVAEILIAQLSTTAGAANASALAEYICTRRAVITVLKQLQRKDDDASKNNYFEELLHNLFFPRFTTSQRIACGPMDRRDREIAHLWLLDERLVFHKLLASDVALSRLKRFLSDSNEPPDLVVFEPAFSTSDNLNDLSSVSIVEFKRPGRNNYGPGLERDPIHQVINYAERIREGTIEDIHGARKSVPHGARLYAYIVADATPTLKGQLNLYGFQLTPDQKGYYLFHPVTRMLIEVIPWDKLILSAEQRNQYFFEQLHLPGW